MCNPPRLSHQDCSLLLEWMFQHIQPSYWYGTSCDTGGAVLQFDSLPVSAGNATVPASRCSCF